MNQDEKIKTGEGFTLPGIYGWDLRKLSVKERIVEALEDVMDAAMDNSAEPLVAASDMATVFGLERDGPNLFVSVRFIDTRDSAAVVSTSKSVDGFLEDLFEYGSGVEERDIEMAKLLRDALSAKIQELEDE